MMDESHSANSDNIRSLMSINQTPNKRYCNRHRPDVVCNRQADARKANEIQQTLETLPQDGREAVTRIWSVFSAAPSAQRLVILQGLLAQCCSPQLSAVSSMIEDLLRVDFIDTLPPEIAVKVLCYLDTASLCKAAQVSLKWKRLADDDVVWHRMCEQHIDRKCTKCGWGLPLLEKKRLRDSKKMIQSRVDNMAKKRSFEEMECHEVEKEKASLSPPPPVEQRLTRPWKDVYAERYRVERNWREGKYQLREFRDSGENDTLMCLQFDDQYLITGTYEGKIKVWDIETQEIVQVLEGHLSAVNALKFDSTKLVTASSDNTVRIWNYKTGEFISTFQGHDENSKVMCLDFDQKLIASGSSDHNIKVWNFEEKSCFTLRGHSESVQSVKICSQSRRLFSASDDCTIKMWNLDTKQCIRTFGGEPVVSGHHVAQVSCILPLRLDHLEGNDDYHHQPDAAAESETESVVSSNQALKPGPTHILSSSLDNTIKLWDVNTGECVRTLFGHVEGVWTIAADTFRIVSGAHDKMVKVWDLQSGKCWHTFTGHTAPVSCVGLSDTRFASCGDDGVVRMYCFDDFESES